MSVYWMEVSIAGRIGQLRIEITDLQGKENWECGPADIIGTHRGRVAWSGNQIGLFGLGDIKVDPKPVPGPDGMPPLPDWTRNYPYVPQGTPAYAVLDIPEDGLDEVAIGSGSSITIYSSGVGQWILKSKTIKPT